MNPKHTWIWAVLAVALFGGIFWLHPHRNQPRPAPKVLPHLRPETVTSLRLRLLGQRDELRVERTTNGWWMTEPLPYAGRGAQIEKLLVALQQLTPATFITRRELEGRPNAEAGFGFDSPQATLTIQQGEERTPVAVGNVTAPGDQVFLQVVGDDRVYVVDAEILKLIPRNANGWRDTTLLAFSAQGIDRVSVTNGVSSFEIVRDAATKQWQMSRPTPARAYGAKIEELIESLSTLQVSRFVSDDPRVDLEALGLQPPALEIAFARGSNLVGVLQFGKSPTNESRQVYARSLGQGAIVTVGTELLAPWRAPDKDFRDPHLVVFNAPLRQIDVRGEDSFSIVLITNAVWRVEPQGFPADAGLVKDLLVQLSELEIVQFVKDVVTDLDLPAYGLAKPRLAFTLLSPATNSAGGLTNSVLAELSFGTNREDQVFARRGDESFIYAIRSGDFDRLPNNSCLVRERRIWNVSTNDLVRVTIRQQGKTRQIDRKAAYDWALAPGSQGILNNVLAIEETVRPLTQLTAESWVARGENQRSRYALTNAGPQITLELKDGSRLSFEVGGDLGSAFPCAGVRLEGDFWIFHLPFLLHRDVLAYLSIPDANER